MYLLGIVFFNYTATTEIYTHLLTLSLNDALPIWPKSPLLSTNDAGGGSTVAQIELEEGTDVFIPVTINREAADAISGGCTIQCFPRSVHLDVGYYQLNTHTKRIIYAELVLDLFDFDSSTTDYSMQVSYRALNYIDRKSTRLNSSHSCATRMPYSS